MSNKEEAQAPSTVRTPNNNRVQGPLGLQWALRGESFKDENARIIVERVNGKPVIRQMQQLNIKPVGGPVQQLVKNAKKFVEKQVNNAKNIVEEQVKNIAEGQPFRNLLGGNPRQQPHMNAVKFNMDPKKYGRWGKGPGQH